MNRRNNDDGNRKILLCFIGFVCNRDKWVMILVATESDN